MAISLSNLTIGDEILWSKDEGDYYPVTVQCPHVVENIEFIEDAQFDAIVTLREKGHFAIQGWFVKADREFIPSDGKRRVLWSQF